MKQPLKALFVVSAVFCCWAAWADQIVATAGSKSISLSEFNLRYQEVVSQTLNPPDKELFLEDLIRYEIGLQEAKKQKIQENAKVQERINQEIYKGLVEKELSKKVDSIQVNENEMKAYYNKYPEIRTSHILIEYPVNSTAEQIATTKKRAEEILDDVKKSKKPFEDLVKLYSDDIRSKKSGGDVGWQNRLTVAPSYYEAALQLKLNGMTGLVQTRFGFHIIKLTGKKPYEEAHKKSVRNSVFDLKRKELFDDYFLTLMKQYKVQRNKGLLN